MQDRFEATGTRAVSGKTRVAVSAVMVAVVLAVGVAFAIGGSDDEEAAVRVGQLPTPTTVIAPSPTATIVPGTTVPPTTAAPVEPGLTRESRISFDGVGPVRFGMAPEQAATAARAVIRPVAEGCFKDLELGPGTGLDPRVLGYAVGYGTNSIEVLQVTKPGLTTSAGIGVGSSAADVERAYPSARREDNGAGWETFRVAGPSGREIELWTENGVVRFVLWGTSRAQIDDSLRC